MGDTTRSVRRHPRKRCKAALPRIPGRRRFRARPRGPRPPWTSRGEGGAPRARPPADGGLARLDEGGAVCHQILRGCLRPSIVTRCTHHSDPLSYHLAY
jgi:hypothetical protein